MPNATLAYLRANRPYSTMGFSGAVTTTSVHLNGPGGQSGTGFPLPRKGRLTGLHVWDGTTYRNDITEIDTQPGDKISLYCQNTGTNFTLKARVNGSSTNLQVAGIPYNVTLFATLEFQLIRD
jgi:hypothetical protein